MLQILQHPMVIVAKIYSILFCFICVATKARSLIKKWAPLVKLASGEPYKPSSVSWFMSQVDLTGYSGTAPDPVTPSNLPACDGSSDSCYLKTQGLEIETIVWLKTGKIPRESDDLLFFSYSSGT